MLGVYFSVSALIILSILAFTYFSKQRVKNHETVIYSKLLGLMLVGLLLEIITCIWVVSGVPVESTIYKLFAKLTAVYYAVWSALFLNYLLNICNYKKDNNKLFNIINLSIVLITVLLPIDFNNINGIIVPQGPSIFLTYGLCFIFSVVDVIVCIKYRKRIVSSKFTPLYALIILGGIAFIVAAFYPQLFIIGYVFSLIVIIMYFTIENPDLQMLREFHRAREYAENSNMEKSNFLFAMAKEVKEPILKINRISKNVLMQDDMELIKHNVSQIKYSSNNLLELVNKVLDINSIESRKVNVRENKYNPANLFKGIISQTDSKLKNNVIEFRTKYDETIPKELYGDSIRIRQIINTLIDNAIKYTDEGFIELNVNSIIKHDICRLIVTVEDSGRGMKQEIVEHILDKNINKIDKIDDAKMDLGLVKTLLDLIGGTIVVNSEVNRGTKFTIVIDQRIVNAKSNKTLETVEKYEQLYLNTKKVMLVINDEKLSKNLNAYFIKHNIEVVTLSMGQDCLERIRNNEKFDLIIMEDNLQKLSHENTLRKLKDIQGFKTPVVLLTNLKEINEREEYLKLGFTEVVTLPLKKEQLNELAATYKLGEE